jgi:hypothetical protein
MPLKHLKHLKLTLATCSFSANISSLLGRIEARRYVEFAGGRGPVVLVGSGSVVVA